MLLLLEVLHVMNDKIKAVLFLRLKTRLWLNKRSLDGLDFQTSKKREVKIAYKVREPYILPFCSSTLFKCANNIAVRVRLQKYQRLDEVVITQQ